MKKIVSVFVSLVFVLAIQTTSYSQFRLKVGPALGMNFNLHSGSDIESGNGFGIAFGGYADMNFTPTIGLIGGISFYDNRSGSYTESGSDPYYGNYTVDVSGSLAYFQLESLFKLQIPNDNFFFVFGPVVGFNIQSQAESTISLPAYNYTSKTSKATIKDTQVRFELKTGAGYDIPVTKFIIISPQLTFGYGLTDVVKDVKWKIMTFQLLAGVKFNLI